MERTPQTPALMVRLFSWYIAVLICLWILQFILMVLANIETSSGGLVATVAAAMVPGDIYFRRTSQLPSRSFGWRMAVGFAVSSLCITFLQLAFSIGLGDTQTQELLGNLQFLFVILFLHVIIIGPLKWCFGWGASSRQRAVLKEAVKARPDEQRESST